MVKKVLFLGQIFEIEFLLLLHVLRSPKSENQVFSGWSVYVCVYVCVCVCVCVRGRYIEFRLYLLQCLNFIYRFSSIL